MPEYVRALAYVLIVAVPALFVAGRVAVPLIGVREFALWRNCWVATTALVFLSGSFLVFAALVGCLCLYIHRRSQQPAMLYIVLSFAAPCVAIGMGIPGVFNRITDLNPPRLLCLMVLLPQAALLWRDPRNRILGGADLPVVGFWLMLSSLAARQEDVASVLRLLPGYAMDILLPYFVFSRTIRTGEDINRALLAFVVAALPLAGIGMFELWRSWRVYYVVVLDWDVTLITPYLFRDGLLRAATTAIEPIAYGFLCMVGAACAISIQASGTPARWRWLAVSLLIGGLGASISRGPWLGFGLFCLIVLLFDERARKHVVPLALALAVAAYVMPKSLTERIINLLPFIGSADEGSETYRERLFEQSLSVIDRHPLFGSKDFLAAPELQSLVQGQGIIDVVNSYLQIVLEFGLVGLILFVSVFAVIGMQLAGRSVVKNRSGVYYASLLGILLSICFAIATTSSVSYIPSIYWAFAGMAAGLFRTVGSREMQAAGMRVLGRGI